MVTMARTAATIDPDLVGKEVVRGVKSDGFFIIPLAIGIGLFIACALSYGVQSYVSIIVAAITIMVSGVVFHFVDEPNVTKQMRTRYEELQKIREAYGQPFYLKEFKSDQSISGKVYGQIGAGGRVVSLVYRDREIPDVYRAVSFPLDKIKLKTVPSGTAPYFTFPETIVEELNGATRLTPGNLHLYLPKGCKIL